MQTDVLTKVNKNLFIDGQWKESVSGQTFEVVNPFSEEVIATVQSAQERDVELAVDAAYRALPEWEATSPRERSEILRRSFQLMTERREEIASLITMESGKSRSDALGEVAYASEFFRWYAEEGVRSLGSFSRAPNGDKNIMVTHHPVGVCLLITPWNFPAAMGTRKIAPALAAGCTVMLKPAAETPLTALYLADLMTEAGVPPGVINVLPSSNAPVISDTALKDARVRKISFTGSTGVGKILLGMASRNVVNCSMELGGNAPFIVLDDADMDVAISSAMVAKMRNAGESCIGANRFYVHSSLIDTFSERMAKEMDSLVMGSGLDPSVDLGPLVNTATRQKVESLVSEALAAGARKLTKDRQVPSHGYFYPPTVLVDIPEHASICEEEIFGPVAAIYSFETVDEVVQKANQTEFGLAAYVIGKNIGNALSVANRIEAGVMGINRGLISDPAAPFGGFKQSGIGREGAEDGLYEFIEKKYIGVEW